MIWPQNLVACTLLNRLHSEGEDNEIGRGISGSGTKDITGLSFFFVNYDCWFLFLFLAWCVFLGFLVA